MKNPIVSVLVPVYNVENYLEKCLESIIAQTLINIEIICVNDGSTDKSHSILEMYEKKDKRIIVVNKNNEGLPSARNVGIDIAKGKYIGFVDSDDYIERRMYEELVEVAEQKNSEIVICGANIISDNKINQEWIENCLSPQFCHYETFEPELLFERVDTTPFLWRTLIKRELLSRNNFRLDEDIIVGEDKAFQCKIYPEAKGITVISDKLYNYYCSRTNSIMNQKVYSTLGEHVSEHVKLVERIGNYLYNKNITLENELFKCFFGWCISFIYNDFIHLSITSKYNTAKKLIPLWSEFGYFKHYIDLPMWKQLEYNYIGKFVCGQMKEPDVSIIVPIQSDSRYIEEMIQQFKNIVDERIEIIIINNGMDTENYIRMQQLLHYSNYVRLYNASQNMSYAEALNKGILLAAGEYITFYDTQDLYYSKELLLNWIDMVQKYNFDLCMSNYCSKTFPNDIFSKIISEGNVERIIWELDFHSCLYKRNFLLEQKLDFLDYSIITGYAFMCKTYMSTNKIGIFQKSVYILRELHTADWISTRKCEKVLSGFEMLINLSLEKKNPYLHGKVFSIMNGDRMKRMILNNTKPYCMPIEQCPNGENSQIETIKKLFQIVKNANIDFLHQYGFIENSCLFELLYEVIEARHIFLNELSINLNDSKEG